MELTLDERVLNAIKTIPVHGLDPNVRVAIVEKDRKPDGKRRGNLYRWILLKGDTHFLTLGDATTRYTKPDGETISKWKKAPDRMNRILHLKCFPFLPAE